ncbi:MAG: hypothetical protein Fur0020_14350 [Thermodesulfovibrionia bacterium]
MEPETFISVVIPNFNGASTISKCLMSVLSSDYKSFEVIVVDDFSDDGSIDEIKGIPCKLIRLQRRSGTSRARNTGAINSRGEFIFFIDSDCILKKDTLSIINRTISDVGRDVIIGGTYSTMPYDRGFFNQFQAIFVNYFETKRCDSPDYIAAHAMVINREIFIKSGGFPESFMPIIEDVEFSHRLKEMGHRLIINPHIEVMHIFNFDLKRSVKNAIRKTMFWSMYSLKKRDVFNDSGTASLELKASVVTLLLNMPLFLGWLFTMNAIFLYIAIALLYLNIVINSGLFKAFYKAGGLNFGIMASLYYITIYTASVGVGSVMGIIRYILKRGKIY